MSWKDAPLYVETHDLACWVLQRAHSWPQRGDDQLSRLAAGAACELVISVSLALTFPPTRADHLECADHAIVRLRTLLRLAGQLELLSAGGLRFASGRLREIGRMVGGWRKRVARTSRSRRRDRVIPTISGDGLPAAAGA